jgi:hypothetical protein
VARGESSGVLRRELEQAIRDGRCAYCGLAGSHRAPLTREHVIPRARGGGRKDVRIMVPACCRCNQLRGCRELVIFLLIRPRRISAFLDHLARMSPECLRLLDHRVVAEVYAAIWILGESAGHGAEWRDHLRRLCSGRTLHRRRYAARRIIGALTGAGASRHAFRPEPQEEPPAQGEPPTCDPAHRGASVEQLDRRLLSILCGGWEISRAEMLRRLQKLNRQLNAEDSSAEPIDRVVQLDGWRRRQRRRVRVDRRRGRASHRAASRGRAA